MNAEQVVLESFSRNARVNRSLLGALTSEHLNLRDPAGGWTIGQHLCDMIDFRRGWMETIAPEQTEKVTYLHTMLDERTFGPRTQNLQEIQQILDQADQVAVEAVQEKLSADAGFQKVYESHPLMFLQHALVHDAHHRGQILMVLRMNGVPWTESDGPMWAPWRE
ncbi:DinB family protein [Deinococcus cellulosilyticus]|uniref:Damage-inducible protein DinB n=1 Tax=Deinococcus cellulosilyticus (strain DSM 18568 / NBRC 106333 / KACC 11606 / 5516J-15) TaxID=1223518 RepID=A0A511N6D5_DEIC1|nr:DinB family protein [Deinococcus cellulosilyticus]GEM47996.1 damage-inducible protein DinB [Deinococcus cellulosilyticus NBRC 106333 = KACC 11606]